MLTQTTEQPGERPQGHPLRVVRRIATTLERQRPTRKAGRAMNTLLDWDEEKAIEAILKHHGVDNRELLADLATFANWIHATEKDKARIGNMANRPPFLLVLLSQMGIYTPKDKKHG